MRVQQNIYTNYTIIKNDSYDVYFNKTLIESLSKVYVKSITSEFKRFFDLKDSEEEEELFIDLIEEFYKEKSENVNLKVSEYFTNLIISYDGKKYEDIPYLKEELLNSAMNKIDASKKADDEPKKKGSNAAENLDIKKIVIKLISFLNLKNITISEANIIKTNSIFLEEFLAYIENDKQVDMEKAYIELFKNQNKKFAIKL